MKETITNINQQDIPELAQVYALVFAGPPWNEVSKCSECGNFSGENVAQLTSCPCGGVFKFPAYPIAETGKYINKELQQPDTQAVKVASPEEIVGFGWGYQTEGETLARNKYSSLEMQTMLQNLLLKSGIFFYVSEVGILSMCQGKGYGSAVTNTLINSARRKGMDTTVLRTNENSPMRYIAEKIGMKAIIGLRSGNRDLENEMRVIFLGER